MSVEMPETPEEMLTIPGVTVSNMEKYGKQLLDVTIGFSAQRFLLLSELDEQRIEDSDSDSVPKAKSSRKPKAAASSRSAKSASNSNDGEWLTCDAKPATKKYTKKRKAYKRKATFKKTGGNKPKLQKKSDYFGSGTKNYSPKPAASTSSAAASKRPTFAGPSGTSNLGFMPMPQPKPQTKQFQF